MLVVETIARVRREHFVKGKTIKEIARDLKIYRNTVRRVLRSGETSFEYEREIQPRPRLGRWMSDLDELLAPCFWRSWTASVAGAAGARPDHPISRHRSLGSIRFGQ
jgi:predicted transcriptional regulator